MKKKMSKKKKIILGVIVGVLCSILITTNIIGLSFVTSSDVPYEVGNKYKVSDDKKTLYFKGEIDGHEFKRFSEFFNEDIETLEVNSVGGDILQAVLMAEVLSKNNIKVVVDGVCGSSCANYLFVSGKTREVKKDSFLMYHGGLTDGTFTMVDTPFLPIPRSIMQVLFYTAVVAGGKPYDGFKARERALYKEAGIDVNIIKTSRMKLEGLKYQFWIPNKDTLQSFGFDTSNISYPKNREEVISSVKTICETKMNDKRQTKEECENRFLEKFTIEL